VEASPLDYNPPAPRPRSWAKWLIDWNGYLLPPPRHYTRDELIEIARANGYRLTPAMLHKWRQWRLIPKAIGGGKTGKGPGKGEQWSHLAACRVAWISRWISAQLTYDVLRLAIWPWTVDLDLLAAEMRSSLQRFLQQDRKYTYLVLGIDDRTADGLERTLARMREGTPIRLYTDIVVLGESSDQERRSALAQSLPTSSTSEVEYQLPFFERMNFDDMEETMATISPELLRESIAAFRASTATRSDDVVGLFWDKPLTLARVITRETHRYALLKHGELKEQEVTSPED
jgi:hypothetical protein